MTLAVASALSSPFQTKVKEEAKSIRDGWENQNTSLCVCPATDHSQDQGI